MSFECDKCQSVPLTIRSNLGERLPTFVRIAADIRTRSCWGRIVWLAAPVVLRGPRNRSGGLHFGLTLGRRVPDVLVRYCLVYVRHVYLKGFHPMWQENINSSIRLDDISNVPAIRQVWSRTPQNQKYNTTSAAGKVGRVIDPLIL